MEFRLGTSMTSTDYIGVSLRLWSHDRSPEEISALLGRTPSSTGTKGTPRGYIRGVPSPAQWKAHYWCEHFSDGETVEQRIEAIVSVLATKKAELKAVLGESGQVDVYVFLALDSTLGIELAPALLRSLGEMGVELGIEIVQTKERSDAPG
jgi:hypothetical protein